MPREKKSLARASAAAALHDVMHEQGRLIPRTPEAVAAFEARHGQDAADRSRPTEVPPPLFSWEITAAEAGKTVVFPVEAASTVPLAYAARKDEPVSPETQAKLARLVAKMKSTPPRRA